ncbi:ATP-binding protein [Glaciibacter superstes]|uniref:ATP-binding protein n=1 Tax=Glaciibacter superstes TaxID=501023 RepID=UPI0003B4818C|nr:ATP-binding protein [Glaciibacter superstes]
MRAVAEVGPNPVVLIDGPSGAGKSTLADALVHAWPTGHRPTLVRLDDIYPGWDGLDAASKHLTEHVLRPRRAGEPAAWQRYDWVKGQPAEWHSVDAACPLVVEGCGTLALANTGLSDIRVWLAANDRERKRRAIDRDGVAFADHWDQWQHEWETYCARETPEQWASIRLTSTPPDRPAPVWPGEY